MSLAFHIGFNGQCEEAFGFYAEHLGGIVGTLLRVKGSVAMPRNRDRPLWCSVESTREPGDSSRPTGLKEGK